MNTRLFVYGTLMNGESAHYMMAEAKFIGNYRLPDYAMYRVAHYPGIVEKAGESVLGELYEIEESMLQKFDAYEAEGDLYLRKEVYVYNCNSAEKTYVYVYNRPVKGKIEREAWNAKSDDYVWYAAYGSNLNRDRFANYIKGGVYPLMGKYCDGCTDKSKWVKEIEHCYPGEMYYGNASSSWEGKGVAFYDRNGMRMVPMRLYKIKRQQLYEIQGYEGSSAIWYGRLLCLDVVDDCPVYTLTSEERRPYNAPCRKYRKLIENELKEMRGIYHE